MKQPDQYVGSTLEEQQAVNAEAQRRLCHTTTTHGGIDGSPHEATSGVQPDIFPVADAEPYSAEERAGALAPAGPLNWNHGQLLHTPAYVPADPLPMSVAEQTGGLSGIEAIVGHTQGDRR
jgi:hypothetical protein